MKKYIVPKVHRMRHGKQLENVHRDLEHFHLAPPGLYREQGGALYQESETEFHEKSKNV